MNDFIDVEKALTETDPNRVVRIHSLGAVKATVREKVK